MARSVFSEFSLHLAKRRIVDSLGLTKVGLVEIEDRKFRDELALSKCYFENNFNSQKLLLYL